MYVGLPAVETVYRLQLIQTVLLQASEMWWQQLALSQDAMGNKLSCSCAPLIRKAYRYEDSPWQTSRRRDGHLLRWGDEFGIPTGFRYFLQSLHATTSAVQFHYADLPFDVIRRTITFAVDRKLLNSLITEHESYTFILEPG